MKKYANKILFSDIEPYEVIEQKTERLLVIREMECKEKEESIKNRIQSFIPGGFCGHYDNDVQDWDIKPKNNGYTFKIRKHKYRALDALGIDLDEAISEQRVAVSLG